MRRTPMDHTQTVLEGASKKPHTLPKRLFLPHRVAVRSRHETVTFDARLTLYGT